MATATQRQSSTEIGHADHHNGLPEHGPFAGGEVPMSGTDHVHGTTFHGNVIPLFSALARAQGEFDPIERTAEGQTGHRKFGYADLAELVSATRPALADEGLAVFQAISGEGGSELTVSTYLTHEDGGMVSMSIELDLDPDQMSTKEGVQWCGALTTYWRRYQYRAILNLADGEDLDEPDAPTQASASSQGQQAAGSNGNGSRPATENQLGYIRDLQERCRARGGKDEDHELLRHVAKSFDQASTQIDRLKGLEKELTGAGADE